jgi:hypothetical protein
MYKGKTAWSQSYTKRVVDELEKHYPISSTWPEHSVHKAVELLRQYHRDLHIPYTERDEARAEVKALEAVVIALLKNKTPAREPVKKVHEFQNYTACAHHPNALSNFFEKRDYCEFRCEKEPLKWYDNGQHRKPGK